MVKTTVKERIILKNLIKTSNLRTDKRIPLRSLKYDIDDYFIKDLISQDLLGTSSIYDDTHPDSLNHPNDSIYVTDEGLHFFDWRREDTRIFIKEHIVTPVTVSIATTLITLLLTKLLGLLW